ncbi:aldolase [Lentinus tigrinus ALCF2SS1-6]|uniref:hydroxymethylglutaryl-CoA lyase n=1 Tax=Lentinus tigrinus ALCF2SS1-6 TaxID=1328759 RepID=A0A5C2RUQ9_9APHY|nr:aldolase [Lentinus tigrinus ALCF2SS1-6]
MSRRLNQSGRVTDVGLGIIELGVSLAPSGSSAVSPTFACRLMKRFRRWPVRPRFVKTTQWVKGLHYPVLVPNLKGLQLLLDLLSEQSPSEVPYTDEIAVFATATDAFSKTNTCTVAESFEGHEACYEGRTALDATDRSFSYVSVVIDCPYSGKVDPAKFKDVSQTLLGMGCCEVGLGDTFGTGKPTTARKLLRTVLRGGIPASVLAGHYHDTYGMGIANIRASLEHGLCAFDSSVRGLGGCPHSPGANGNVATKDSLYALPGSKYETPRDLNAIAEVETWISKTLNRTNSSRIGTALKLSLTLTGSVANTVTNYAPFRIRIDAIVVQDRRHPPRAGADDTYKRIKSL